MRLITSIFRDKLHRNPTDVELMDLFQSNNEHCRRYLCNGKVVVEVSEAFYRPTDVVNLWGDPTKARTVLGWNPQRTSYEELCRLMAEHDLKLAKAEAVVLKETAE